MMELLEECGVNRYKIRKHGRMNNDVFVYLSKPLLRYMESEAAGQLVDGACLPGVCRPVIGMPDIHTGFGLPIGGVMATAGPDGVISAGAVGMDINCGVRLLAGNFDRHDAGRDFLRRFLQTIEQMVPCGVGRKSKHTHLDVEAVLQEGAADLARIWPAWRRAVHRGRRLHAGGRPRRPQQSGFFPHRPTFHPGWR